MIRLKNITFGYNGNTRLFNELEFCLPEGGSIGITGPNGCGKTTLFNIIMGFVKPLTGIIEIEGQEIKTEKEFQKARQNIGFLFQNSDDQLFCPSVREEVAFGPLNYRLPRNEIEQRIKESLQFVGLAKLEERSPYSLSEGEKKKLALATILALKPKILLLDEPTNGLDKEGTKFIEELLLQENLSYIITSQDCDFLKKNTTEIFHIKNGKLEKL